MAVSPCFIANDQKKHWRLTNRKVVNKYIKDAKCLIATQDQNEIVSALNLLDVALSFSELKKKVMARLNRNCENEGQWK